MKPPERRAPASPDQRRHGEQRMASTRLRLPTVRTPTSRPTGDIRAPPHALEEAREDEMHQRIRQRAADRGRTMNTAMAVRKRARPVPSAIPPEAGLKMQGPEWTRWRA